MEAPERIWTCNETKNIWISDEQEDTTEYIRADTVTALQAEVDRLREALKRLSTPACMGDGRALGICIKTHPIGQEIGARMDYARAALSGNDA